jgi:hypothetical protein
VERVEDPIEKIGLIIDMLRNKFLDLIVSAGVEEGTLALVSHRDIDVFRCLACGDLLFLRVNPIDKTLSKKPLCTISYFRPDGSVKPGYL